MIGLFPAKRQISWSLANYPLSEAVAGLHVLYSTEKVHLFTLENYLYEPDLLMSW